MTAAERTLEFRVLLKDRQSSRAARIPAIVDVPATIPKLSDVSEPEMLDGVPLS
jgi:hypothetical protein